MDEQYLNDLYNWITTKDKSFGVDYSASQFISDMADSEYASEMYGWVAKNDPTFANDYSLESFLKDVGADKKKGGYFSNAFSNTLDLINEEAKKQEQAQKRSKSIQVKDGDKPANEYQKSRVKDMLSEFEKKPTDDEIFGSKRGTIKTSPEGEPIYTPPTVSRESTRQEKPVDVATAKEKEEQIRAQKEKEYFEKSAKEIRNFSASSILSNQEKEDLIEDEKRRAKDAFERVSSDKDLFSNINAITSDLIGKSEESVVPDLNEKFSKYGFNFQQSGWADDEMIVSTDDGRYSITIDLNPSKSVDKNKEAEKLKNFLSKYNVASEKEKTPIDKEGEKFYAERGRDYYVEKRRWERYSELSDIVGFFEGYGGDKEEIQKEHPELFFEGEARWDIKNKLAEYKKEIEALRPLIKDNTFFSQGNNSIERTREDFDSYLANKEKEIIKASADINKVAKSQEDLIKAEARQKFNMDFEDLLYFKSDNPEYQAEIDDLTQRFISAQELRKQAATKYQDAKLYYDEKINKEIEGDLTDDFSALWNTVSDNYKEGLVNDQLLALAMPGLYIPYSGTTDIKEATEYIIKKREQMSGTQSRVEVRLANAKSKQEYLDIMLDNPLESITIATAGSLALMLPTGFKIIPAFTLAGGVTGAASTAVAGPGGAGVGFISGSKKGFDVGQAVNNYAVEYTAAVMDAVKRRGYNAMDPESLQAALEDPKIWDDARDQGMARGVPIAIADYVSSSLVGRVFKPASALTPMSTKVALGAAERLVVDPTLESGGEALAQLTEIKTGTGRTEMDWKEIVAEGRGAMGSKVPNMAIELYSKAMNNKNAELAKNLTILDNVGKERASDTRISKWADNMQKLGKIDADVNQRIQENVGLKRDARELLSVGDANRQSDGPVIGRVMELLSAKKELTSTKERQEVYSEKIKEINSELAILGQTKKLVAEDKKTSLDGIVEAKRSDVSEYMINGRAYNKEGFINKINSMSPNRLSKSTIGVKGDQETSNLIKDKYNAIPKQATGQVPVQSETGVSQEMEGGKPKTELEVAAQESFLTPEENQRKETLIKALAKPENKQGTITIDKTPMNRAEAQTELDGLIKKETAPVKQEEKISILETPDNTAKALTELTAEEKTNVTFTNDQGENVPVSGNEKMLSDLYHQAIGIEEDQRTDAQQSAIDTVELALTEKITAEKQIKEVEKIAAKFKPKPTTTTTTAATTAATKEGVSASDQGAFENVKQSLTTQFNKAKNENEKTKAKNKLDVIDKAKKAVNTLKSIFPDFDIVIHDNEQSYNKAASQREGEQASGGTFSYYKKADGTYANGRIDINLERANMRTVAHEVAHAILLKAFGDNPALFKNFRDKISKVLNESANKALMDFADQYEGDISFEEYLVELTAALSNEEGSIKPTTLMKIATLINNIISKLTNGALKPFEDVKNTKDVIDFFDTISKSIREGERIDIEAVTEKITETKPKSEVGKISKQQKVEVDTNKIQELSKNNPEVFENLKNKIIFGYGKEKRTTRETKPTQERVQQEAIGENKNEYIKTISDITRRVLEKKTLSGLLNKPGHQEIEKLAKDNGFFYPSFDFISKGRTPKKGIESLVYVDDSGKNVIKINNGIYNTDWADFFNRIMAHNIYFPETSYEFLGFTKRDGRLAAILRQPLVNIKRGASPAEVKEEIQKRGFNFKSIYNVIDDYNNVSLRDFHDENAVFDTDGNMVFIDPIIETNDNQIFSNYVSDKYNEAVEDGSNPEFVNDVEEALGEKVTKRQLSAYHGSPHKFDKFTTAKIGTGEGAQAFGWGLYFTDIRDIAKNYANNLSEPKIFLDGKEISDDSAFSNVWFVVASSKNKEEAKDSLIEWGFKNKEDLSLINKALKELEKVNTFDVKKQGLLYDVTLHKGKTPDQYTWLEWDKKIPSNIERKLTNSINNSLEFTSEEKENLIPLSSFDSASGFYNRLSEFIGPKEASLFLLENGIDGIKYPAESLSRGATSETARGFNYVVFDENAVEIVSRSQKVKNELQQIIEESLANGIPQDAIKAYLRNMGLSESDIDGLMETVKTAAKKVTVSEQTLPGYDRMMNEVNNIISKSKSRGATEEKILENVMNYLEGSKAYENATDVQREQMVRDIRKMFGKREKSAPSVEKLFGDIKNVNKITLTEKELFNKQLKDLNKGAKDAKSAWLNASSIVSKAIKELVLSGKITTNQAANVISRFSKVNMFDDSSIERFVDYMSKVFEDANYLEKISNAKKLLRTAKDNIRTKLGMSEVLTPLLDKLFNINPSLIPSSVFDSYLELVDMMGKRQSVLTLKEVNELTGQVNEILDTIQDELSTLDELIDVFNDYDGKVFGEDGKIDFNKTLNAMISDPSNPITPEDAELLKKYKSKVIPRVGKQKMTEEQKAEEKKALIDSIRKTTVDENKLLNREERDLARDLVRLIKSKGLDGLSNTELRNLLKVLDNINNGFISHYALLMREKINAVNNSLVLDNTIAKAGSLPITKLIARLKALFPYQPSTQKIMVREAPKYFIDQVFGNFKDKPIFRTVFEKVAQGFAKYKTDVNLVKEKLDVAFNKVAKSHWNNPKKVKMSTYKMMAYALQLEYESNKDSANFYSAADYIKATIKNGMREDSSMSKYDVDLLRNVLKVYGKVIGKDEKGNDVYDIDKNKLYNSFNEAEKSAIKTIQSINNGLKNKALFTSAVIRGDKVKVIDNYIHHSVLPSGISSDIMSSMSGAQAQSNLMNPSTRAKSLQERTKGVKPLNFDIFSVTQRSANQVLLDFHLTEPVRTARKTLKMVEDAIGDRDMVKNTLKDVRVFEAIDDAFETSLKNVLTNNFNDNSFANNVVNFLTKQAYRTMLASAKRWIAELTSNIAFIMTVDPKAYIQGATKYRNIVMSDNAVKILQNVGSTQSERLYSDSLLSGRMIDNSSMNQAVGMDGSPTKNAVANAIQTIYNNTLKKYPNFVATTADTLISTPDKIMMRPFWFGVFANNFKKITGQEVDFNKIAEGDEAYVNQFKEAIDFSRSNADQMSVFAGTTTNPFMTRQKGTVTVGAKPLAQLYNTFNSFMNNFIVYEYVTARTGIYALMGNGNISRKQGFALLAASVIRTTSYTLIAKLAGDAIMETIFGYEDDDDDDESIYQKLGQATAGSMTSLILGRDFGNMSRSIINYGVEGVNENYLQFLRNGDYTLDDAISFSAIPPEKSTGRPDFLDLIINMAGPMQPALKTGRKVYMRVREGEPQKAGPKKARELDFTYNIPLEVLGNAGLVPLYKDVKTLVNEDIKQQVAKATRIEERRNKLKSESEASGESTRGKSSGRMKGGSRVGGGRGGEESN